MRVVYLTPRNKHIYRIWLGKRHLPHLPHWIGRHWLALALAFTTFTAMADIYHIYRIGLENEAPSRYKIALTSPCTCGIVFGSPGVRCDGRFYRHSAAPGALLLSAHAPGAAIPSKHYSYGHVCARRVSAFVHCAISNRREGEVAAEYNHSRGGPYDGFSDVRCHAGNCKNMNLLG